VGHSVTYHNGYLFVVAFVVPLTGLGHRPSPGSTITSAIFFNANTVYGAEITSAGGAFDVLLGMDILSGGSLHIEGNGTWSFSF
jgi:hypothetical protein